MQVPRVLAAVRRHLLALIVLTMLGGIAGAGIELSRPSAYVATIRMFANQGKANSTPVSQSPSLAVARMTTFVQFADSTALAERLVERLELPDTPKDLSSRMSASLDRDTVIMTLTVSAATETDARTIARAVPDEYTVLANELAGVRVTSETATIFTIFDGPRVAPTRSVPRVLASVALGMAIVGSLAVAGILALERRRTARDPQVLAAVTGLPVLGIIPRPDPDENALWIGPVDDEQRLACHRLARNLPVFLERRRRLVVVTSPREPDDSLEVSVGLAGALAQRGDRVLLLDAGGVEDGVASLLGPGLAAPEEPDPVEVGLFTDPYEIFHDPTVSDIDDVFEASGVEGDLTADAAQRGSLDLAARRLVDDALAGSRDPVFGQSGTVAAREVTQVPGLWVAVPGDAAVEFGSGRTRHEFREAISRAQDDYDVVVVHAAPILTRSDLPTAIEDAHAVLLVVDQFHTSLDDCVSATASLRAMSPAGSGLVVHQAVTESLSSSQYLSGVVTATSTSAPGSATAGAGSSPG